MVNEITSSMYLAGVGECTGACAEGTKAFWASDIGGILGGILAVLGVLVVIAAVVKGFGKVTSGKIGDAVKIGVGAAIFATFLFNPELVSTVIGFFSTIVENILGGASDVVEGSKGAGQ